MFQGKAQAFLIFVELTLFTIRKTHQDSQVFMYNFIFTLYKRSFLAFYFNKNPSSFFFL